MTPLLLRCLALLVLSVIAYLCHVAVVLTGSAAAGRHIDSRQSRLSLLSHALLSFSQSFVTLAVSTQLVSVLLSPQSPLSSLLPTSLFALHAAFLCAPTEAERAVAVSPASLWHLNSDSAPLLCAWLSCYWLVLDHDDRWQIWPLAPLLALHASHAALALTRTVRAQHGEARKDEAYKVAFV